MLGNAGWEAEIGTEAKTYLLSSNNMMQILQIHYKTNLFS